MISVGVGVQIQYADADLSKGLPFASAVPVDGWNSRRHRLGLRLHRRRDRDADADHHHRSRLPLGDQSEDQRHDAPSSARCGSVDHRSASTTLNLARCRVSSVCASALTRNGPLLGTVEWTNWSRIGTSACAGIGAPAGHRHRGHSAVPVSRTAGSSRLAPNISGTDRLALRAGVGLREVADHRPGAHPAPAGQRPLLAVGRRHLQLTPKMSFDLGLFAYVREEIRRSTSRRRPAIRGSTATAYAGTVDSHIDIISVAMHYRWDDPAPAPAPKQGYFKAK